MQSQHLCTVYILYCDRAVKERPTTVGLVVVCVRRST